MLNFAHRLIIIILLVIYTFISKCNAGPSCRFGGSGACIEVIDILESSKSNFKALCDNYEYGSFFEDECYEGGGECPEYDYDKNNHACVLGEPIGRCVDVEGNDLKGNKYIYNIVYYSDGFGSVMAKKHCDLEGDYRFWRDNMNGPGEFELE
jgi:hypothetical protein